MIKDVTYFQGQIALEILGTLTEQEMDELMDAVANNEEIRLIREDMKANIDSVRITDYLHQNQNSALSSYIFDTVKKERRAKKKKVTLTLVASIFLVVSASSLWLINSLGKTNKELVVANNPSASIVLQLPGGRSIALDSANRQIHSGDVTISTRNNTLDLLTKDSDHPQLATLIVPAGKNYQINLSDGTEVHLNSGTSMRFPLNFDNNSRDIELHGEAYIAVVPDANRPFRVITPYNHITVLGTEFNVNTYDSLQQSVALVKGSVKVSTVSDSVILKPRQQGLTSGNSMIVKPFDESEVLAWLEGKYYFNNSPIRDIVPIINRWYGIKIVVDNGSIGRERFTGMIYRNKPVSVLLKALQETNVISYFTDSIGTIHIK